jgi:TonB family protein
MRGIVIMLAASAISGIGPTGQASDIPLVSAANPPPGLTFPKKIEPPTPIQPHYPPLAIRCGMTGTATLELLVAADGSVGGAKIVSSTGYTALDSASLDVTRQFRYTPATMNGVAVPVRVNVVQNWEFAGGLLPGQSCTLPASAFTNGTPPPGSPDKIRTSAPAN